MNVYDFDNTIYDGESVFDFYIYCVLRHPSLIKYIFTVLYSWAKYRLTLLSRDKLMILAEKYAADFFSKVQDIESLVSEFWDKKQHKIKNFYLDAHREDDVVISASVSFLLEDICRRLGIKHLICSRVDTGTGHVHDLCFRHSKPGYFRDRFPMEEIENFYSDSMNDKPMMLMAKNAYLVKGSKIIPVPKKKLN